MKSFLIFLVLSQFLIILYYKKFYGLKLYWFNILISIDQFINVFPFLGDPDETISARIGRAIKSERPRFFVKPLWKIVDGLAYLLAGEKNHCFNSIEPEEPIYKKEIWSWIKERK